MKLDTKKALLFLISITLPLTAGLIGSLFTFRNIPIWYEGLSKPSFSPPNWLFGPVWTLLYLMMGVSLYLVAKKQKSFFSPPVRIFIVHLLVNSLWSIVFFGMRNPGLAFFVIIILWGLIYYIIKIFHKIDIKASYLLYPYLAWVSFASLLNLSIWLLNI